MTILNTFDKPLSVQLINFRFSYMVPSVYIYDIPIPIYYVIILNLNLNIFLIKVYEWCEYIFLGSYD